PGGGRGRRGRVLRDQARAVARPLARRARGIAADHGWCRAPGLCSRAELKEDEAIAAADTLLLTVPNQLGVDYNAHVIDSILTHVAPALGRR
ncbi:MAG TPA: hypothetical protein VIY52_24635, partial [Streptosporangiaceae bacterium]